jgi:hypothetical protein
MPGHAQREGLAGARLSDHQGDAGAALAEVAHHSGLVLARGRMRGQRGPHRVMANNGGLLADPVGGGGDQPLLHGQQFGGGPAALLQCPIRHHGHGPLGTEPVGQLLELGPGGSGEVPADGGDDVLAGEGGRGRGQPVRSGQPIEQPTGHLRGHRPVLAAVGCPAGHRPDQGVRVLSALGRLPPPPSIQGVRRLVLLGLASGLHGPLDQP